MTVADNVTRVLVARLFHTDIHGIYDNPNMSGVVRPASSVRGSPDFCTSRRITLSPRRRCMTEEAFLRTFVRALTAAACKGRQRLPQIRVQDVNYFVESSLPEPCPANLVISTDLEPKIRLFGLQGHVVTLKYLPKKTIIALGSPRYVGTLGTDGHPPQSDYYIDPRHVTGLRVMGKIGESLVP